MEKLEKNLERGRSMRKGWDFKRGKEDGEDGRDLNPMEAQKRNNRAT